MGPPKQLTALGAGRGCRTPLICLGHSLGSSATSQDLGIESLVFEFNPPSATSGRSDEENLHEQVGKGCVKSPNGISLF